VATRTWYVIGFTLLCIAAAILVPAIPQPTCYHDFADRRAGFGIENVRDVVSNVGFLLAGVAGLAVVLRPRTRFEFASERWPYGIFFLGVLLTAAGSAYYHLAPDNERLFWDRLPIAIGLMSLIAAQVVDRVSVRAGLVLLVPAVLAGVVSTIYWIVTERAGVGNVVPYVVVQVYAVVMLLVLALLLPSRYTRGSDVYWVVAAYVIAKLMEHFDREVFALGNVVSGHTLKHVAAAVACFVVCRMLYRRALITGERTRLVG
jgi:hypothetical protein